MIVRLARDVARRWVLDHAAGEPGFQGAFYHGSIGWLPDDLVLPATSDVDVMVVSDDAERRVKPGKFRYRDVLLEVSFLPSEQAQSPEMILARPELAGSFRTPSVISDPSGRLTRLQEAVARDYARRRWVMERCEGIQTRILRYLYLLRRTAALPRRGNRLAFRHRQHGPHATRGRPDEPDREEALHGGSRAPGRVRLFGFLRRSPGAAGVLRDDPCAGRISSRGARRSLRRRQRSGRDAILFRFGPQRCRAPRRNRRQQGDDRGRRPSRGRVLDGGYLLPLPGSLLLRRAGAV